MLTSKNSGSRSGHSRLLCTCATPPPPLRLREAGGTRARCRLAGKKSLSIHSLNTSLLWAMKIRGKLHLGDIFRGKKADSQLTEGMQQSAHTAPALARGGFPPLPCDITAPCVIRLTGTRKRERRWRILAPDHCRGLVAVPGQIDTSPLSHSPKDALRAGRPYQVQREQLAGWCTLRPNRGLIEAGQAPQRPAACWLFWEEPIKPTGSGWAVPPGLWGEGWGLEEDLQPSPGRFSQSFLQRERRGRLKRP